MRKLDPPFHELGKVKKLRDLFDAIHGVLFIADVLVVRCDHLWQSPQWQCCARLNADCAERRRPLETKAEGSHGQEEEDHLSRSSYLRLGGTIAG